MQATDLPIEETAESNVEGLMTPEDVERRLIGIVATMLESFEELAYEVARLHERFSARERREAPEVAEVEVV